MQPTPEMIQEFLENIGEDGENGDHKRSKSAHQYFYRHHYLSIIQEEEEHSDVASAGR